MNDEMPIEAPFEDPSLFVLISYRRRSSSFAAQACATALRAARYDTFVDTESISDGNAYRDVIRSGLARSDLVLALIAHDLQPGGCTRPSTLWPSNGVRRDSTVVRCTPSS